VALFGPFQAAADRRMTWRGYRAGANWDLRSLATAAHSEQGWRERHEAPLIFLRRP
jgi:hypothetical protein